MPIEILFDQPVSPNLLGGDAGLACAYPFSAILEGDAVGILYRQGETKQSPDGVLMLQTSCDGGVTWSEPRLVFDGRDQEPTQTACTGLPCQLPGGTLLVSFFTTEGLRPGVELFGEEGFQLPRRKFLTRSVDGGQTWSRPARFEIAGMPFSATASKPFVLEDGEVAMPIEYYADDHACRTAIMFSRDGGRTFGPAAPIAADPTGQLSYGDARFCVLPDGRLLMLLWTFRQSDEATLEVHRSWSHDRGRTWTPPEGVGFVGQVTTPLALSSGAVIAASNCRDYPEGIRLWFSADGDRWDTAHPVQVWDARSGRMLGARLTSAASASTGDDGGVWAALGHFSFGSPDLLLLDDESVLMTYYATVDGISHVRVCRFRVAG